MDSEWNAFAASGRVEDYLKYRESTKNANDGKGPDNKRTDNRGE